MNLSRLPVPFLALVLLLSAGCDSNDGSSDLEALAGTHRLVAVTDSRGDQTQTFSLYVREFTIIIRPDNSFRMTILTTDLGKELDRMDTNLDGTFTLNSGQKVLTMGIPFMGGTVPVEFRYVMDGNRTRFSTSAAVFNQLLNLVGEEQFTGGLTLTVERRP